MSDAATTVLTTIEAPSGDAPNETPEVEAQGAPETGAPAAETPKPPEVDPRLEISRKLQLAATRESRARRAEQALADKTRAVEEREKAAEARAAKLEEEQAEWDADPVAFHLKRGKDPVEAVRRFAKPQSEEEKRIAQLEAKLTNSEKAEEERRKTHAQRQEEAQRHASLQRFVGGITPDEFPFLTTMHPAHEVPKLVEEMLGEPAGEDENGSPISSRQKFKMTHGRNPTNAEVASALEQRTENRARDLYEALKKRFETAPQQAAELPPAISGPPSLSNAHAGRVTPKGSPSNLSREERIAESRKRLRERTDAEAAELSEP